MSFGLLLIFSIRTSRFIFFHVAPLFFLSAWLNIINFLRRSKLKVINSGNFPFYNFMNILFPVNCLHSSFVRAYFLQKPCKIIRFLHPSLWNKPITLKYNLSMYFSFLVKSPYFYKGHNFIIHVLEKKSWIKILIINELKWTYFDVLNMYKSVRINFGQLTSSFNSPVAYLDFIC